MAQTRNPENVSTDADAIQKRLLFLVKDRAQADISRRTGAPVANVNRYLRGTKIPAEFCAGLVRNFGVNPAWLLTGDGTPYLADVTAETTGTATDLLELVEAMNAVTKMRLGALVGKDHLKTLRQLNDTLNTFERLRARLNEQSSPIFKQLLADYRKALGVPRLESAAQLRHALHQVARLCADRELKLGMVELEARHENLLGHDKQALELQRQMLNRSLVSSATHPHQFCVDAGRYVIMLGRTWRIAEARRYCRAAIALAARAAGSQVYKYLCFMEGVANLPLGRVHEAVELMLPLYAQLLPGTATQKMAAYNVVQALLYTGTMTTEEALSFAGKNLVKDAGVLVFACWREERGSFRGIYNALIDSLGWPSAHVPCLATYAECLKEALESTSKKILKTFDKSPEVRKADANHDPRTQLRLGVYRCRLAVLVKDKTRALRECAQVEESIASMPQEMSIPYLLLGTHYRSVLDLIPVKTRSEERLAQRARAQAFFDDSFARGFGCFREFASEAEGSSNQA